MTDLNNVFKFPTKQHQLTILFATGLSNPMAVRFVGPFLYRACVGITVQSIVGHVPGNALNEGDTLLLQSNRICSLANVNNVFLSNVLPGSTDVQSSNVIAHAQVGASAVINPFTNGSVTWWWHPTSLDGFDLTLAALPSGLDLVTSNVNFNVVVQMVVHTLVETVQQ